MTDKDGSAPKIKSASTWFRANGFNIGVVVTLILAIAGGMRGLGKLEERSNSAHENIKRVDEQLIALSERLDRQVATANGRIDDQFTELNEAREAALSDIRTAISVLQGGTQEDPVVFVDGAFASGYDMGVNTSEGMTDWTSVDEGILCMNYPSGQQWGAVLITMGQPSAQPRAGRDFSAYRSLAVEVRGKSGGESVWIGLKDNTDPDDGSETKVHLADLTTDWRRIDIELTRFRTADLTRLYVVTEFVFETAPAEVCIRKIEFLQ